MEYGKIQRILCGRMKQAFYLNFKMEENIMTFKEMIFKGLCDGTVKIISNPNDDCIACRIGEFWFYFIGNEDEDLTPSL